LKSSINTAKTGRIIQVGNSGTVGVGDVEIVGLDDAGVPDESDMAETVLERPLETKTSPTPES
jgi:hypothetical protein